MTTDELTRPAILVATLPSIPPPSRLSQHLVIIGDGAATRTGYSPMLQSKHEISACMATEGVDSFIPGDLTGRPTRILSADISKARYRDDFSAFRAGADSDY